MAEEKSLWQRFLDGAKRVFSFPERKAEETRQKIHESINGPSKVGALAEDAKFSSQFPFPYGVFLHTFQPANEQEKVAFNHMKEQLKTGNMTIDAFSDVLAKIGNAPVLFDLWEKHQDSQDASIRKLIVENPRCPKEILNSALADKDRKPSLDSIMNEAVKRAAQPSQSQLKAPVRDTGMEH